jgi:hypothetical protein
MQSLPSSRLIVALIVLASVSSALAVCQPPDASLDWRFAGEIVQNVRVLRSEDRAVSGWRTVTAVSNFGSSSSTATLKAGYDTNTTVSATIARWGLGRSERTTVTHTFDVTVPARSRVRLLHQRRDETRTLSWDVMCAWQHARTGEARLTLYGRGYRGTTWRLYDVYDVRTERL